MKTARFTITFIFFIFFTSSFSQEANDTTDNPYFISYRDRLQINAIGVIKLNSFDITDNLKKNDVFEYSTNENFNIGLGFNYKWLGFSMAFNLPAINNDDELYGKTTGIDLQLDVYTKKWLFNFSSNFYSGFYWKNPDLIYSDWNIKDSVDIHPDIASVLISASGLFTIKDDQVSLRSAYIGNESQQHSAGSWLIGWQTSVYGMGSENRLLPDIVMTNYPNIYRTQSLSSFTLGISFGYTYTYVGKKGFFANFVALPGINLQSVNTKQFGNEELYTKPGLSSRFNLRFSLGFQKENYYLAFQGIGDTYNLKTDFDTRYKYSYGRIKLQYGYRF